jgi:RNA-binding protein YlmH
MEKRQMIAALAEGEEDKLLLARIYDRIQGGFQKNIPAATPFLSPREQEMARRLLKDVPICFFGGYEEAERAVCCYIPDYYEPEFWLTGEESPVCAVRATFYAGDHLTHRDFLGALMGSGIKRETVGDILVSEGQCDFLVTREICPYVLEQFDSAGRTRLHLSPLPLEELLPPQVETKELRETVATLRLDSIVAAGFGLSRAKAASAVESGRTAVNNLPCEKPDRMVEPGDKISVRGLGKMELTAVSGTTKKGRTGVIIRRYV